METEDKLKRSLEGLHKNPYELYSKLFKGGIWGSIKGTPIGVMKEDTRSLDNGSCELCCKQDQALVESA